MWKQQAEYSDNTDKCCMDLVTGDSGFLSSCNSIGYSSELSSNSIRVENQSVSSDSMNDCTDSGIDFGLSDSFNQLSLKKESLNIFNTSKICLQPVLKSTPVNINCERVSMTTSIEKHKEDSQEQWREYFTQNEDGDTLLHSAIIQGYLEATLALIKIAPYPCLLDILNDDGQTPLHLAVITNQPILVRRLVLAGSDLSIRNCQGNTALHLACMSGNLDCAKALTEPLSTFEKNGLQRLPPVPQNLEQQNYNGEACLHIAASRGHVELVQLLVQRGANLEAQESLGGRTALHLGLEHGQLDVVLYLAQECRSHLDAATYAGYTAYQIASCVDERLACELVRLGATPMSLQNAEVDIYDKGFDAFACSAAAAQASA